MTFNFYQLYNLLNENTVSQEIKRLYGKQKDPGATSGVKDNTLNNYIKNVIKSIDADGYTFLSENSKKIIAKWMIYHRASHPISLGGYMVRDFLSDNIDQNGNLNPQLASKFNNINFKPEDLSALDHEYHENLKRKQKKIQGAIGKNILSFPDGYSWVNLEKGYCDVESQAMGHCGNSGAHPDDTILSLRDKKNFPHLTFILNKGELGQTKGPANTKPLKKYHKYIIELLKLPIVKNVVGGGHKPENNFKLSDLEKDQLEELIKAKPDFENDFIIEKIDDSKENIEGIWHYHIDDFLTKEEIFKFLEKIKNKTKKSKKHSLSKSIVLIAHYTKNPEVLNELVEKFYSDSALMATVASNKNSTIEILEKLVHHNNTSVKENISRNDNATIEIFKKLSEDQDFNVKIAVVGSPILKNFFSTIHEEEAKKIFKSAYMSLEKKFPNSWWLKSQKMMSKTKYET